MRIGENPKRYEVEPFPEHAPIKEPSPQTEPVKVPEHV